MERWKLDGVRIVAACDLDPNTPQTAGHESRGRDHDRDGRRAEAVGRDGAIDPDARTGAHHHGELESVIYVVRGRARMRWGERLEFVGRGGPGRLHLRAAVRAAPGDQRGAGPSRSSASWSEAAKTRSS